MASKGLCLCFLLVLLGVSSNLALGQVLFQGFNWESWKQNGGWYNLLMGKVEDIAAAGITHVWLPPPSHSVAEFYDHFFDWGLKNEIVHLVSIRNRHGIHPESELRIIESDVDLYLAEIDGKVITKLGPRYDVGHLIPDEFQVAAHGDGYAVWEKV